MTLPGGLGIPPPPLSHREPSRSVVFEEHHQMLQTAAHQPNTNQIPTEHHKTAPEHNTTTRVGKFDGSVPQSTCAEMC